MRDYAPAYSQAALDALMRTERAQRTRAIDSVERLCRHPHQAGDFNLPDEDGRLCHVLMDESVLLPYWVDDAVCEVRITAIEWTD